MQIHYVARCMAPSYGAFGGANNSNAEESSSSSRYYLLIYPCQQTLSELITCRGFSTSEIDLSFPAVKVLEEATSVVWISNRDFDHLLQINTYSSHHELFQLINRNQNFYQSRLFDDVAFSIFCYQQGLFASAVSLDSFYMSLLSVFDVTRIDRSSHYADRISSCRKLLESTDLRRVECNTTSTTHPEPHANNDHITQYHLISRLSLELKSAIHAKNDALKTAASALEDANRLTTLIECHLCI